MDLAVDVVLRLTLLWLVKGSSGLHDAEKVSGGVALEAAADLGVGFLLGASAGQVVLSRLVTVDHAPVHDGVQGPVEVAVAEAVEAGAG